MALDINTYDERPLRIEAVRVTTENIEELAKWMEAHSYTIQKFEDSDRMLVTFDAYRLGRERTVHISRGDSGVYLVKNHEGRFDFVPKEKLKMFWKKVK